jgi:uncharacterized protein
MGYKSLQIKMRTDYQDIELNDALKKQLGFNDFSFKIEKKSLDARKKTDIHWLLNIVVQSDCFKSGDDILEPVFPINYKSRNQKVVVVGNGPAGFFAAYVLQLSGFQVIMIERGSDVEKRTRAIDLLDKNGLFSPQNNYAFGEGGAGTFSDGKLTSRSKSISAERLFILKEYVKAGAPQEILYMAHPHIGTDNLKIVVANLRQAFIEKGGEVLFDTLVTDLKIVNNKVEKVICNTVEIEAQHFIFATGHSAYETYRMLIDKGVHFKTKNFAIGHRIEHPQDIINTAQWGKARLPGVKAAEYRLSTTTKSGMPVYTFCMCPGGTIVPAAAYDQMSVVNGMSYYERNGRFSNAGCVTGVHPDMLVGHKAEPLEILNWMDERESEFYNFSHNLVVPSNYAKDYINKKVSKNRGQTSYLLGNESAPLFNMLPSIVTNAISEGIVDFSKKLNGFDSGLLLGFESKTSSPIQVEREKLGKCLDFDNLYMVGEGSGYAGGIISSAADGVKCALDIAINH